MSGRSAQKEKSSNKEKCESKIKLKNRGHIFEKHHWENETRKPPSQKAYLTKHQPVKISKVSYECDFCHKSFILSKALTEHLETHSAQEPCCCAQCRKSFPPETPDVVDGSRRRSETVSYQCVVCGQTFNAKAKLQQHECGKSQNHRDETIKINKRKSRKETRAKSEDEPINRHRQQESKNVKHRRTSLPLAEQDSFQCAKCDVSFNSRSIFVRHFRTHFEEKTETSDSIVDEKHSDVKQNKPRLLSEKNPPGQWDKCEKTLKEKDEMSPHQSKNRTDTPASGGSSSSKRGARECDNCDKPFREKDELFSTSKQGSDRNKTLQFENIPTSV